MAPNHISSATFGPMYSIVLLHRTLAGLHDTNHLNSFTAISKSNMIPIQETFNAPFLLIPTVRIFLEHQSQRA